MNINNIHDFNLNQENDFLTIQTKLKKHINLENPISKDALQTCAGVDLAYWEKDGEAFGVWVVGDAIPKTNCTCLGGRWQVAIILVLGRRVVDCCPGTETCPRLEQFLLVGYHGLIVEPVYRRISVFCPM